MIALDSRHFPCLSVSLHINKLVTHQKVWLIKTSFDIFIPCDNRRCCTAKFLFKKKLLLGGGNHRETVFLLARLLIECPSDFRLAPKRFSSIHLRSDRCSSIHSARFSSILLRIDRYSCCPCVEQDIQLDERGDSLVEQDDSNRFI